MKNKILVIDDDVLIRDGIRINLENEGFDVITAANGNDGIRLFKENNPDLCLIDIMLPDITGFEILDKVKKIDPGVIAIFLTARNEIYDKISGFSLGADDYVTKPFDIRELILRIRVRLKTKAMEPKLEPVEIIFGDIRIIPNGFKVYKSSQEVQFTKTEFELLNYFVLNENIVLSREQIFEKIWGNDADFSSRTVDMHVSRIRKKIEDDIKNPKFIETIFGVGYVFRK
ncbi:response regulator transcription factor [bacterium]|nr:response regulator transcription factor [bacterium]